MAIVTNDIVVDGSAVYVANALPGGGGEVLRLDKATGASTTLSMDLRLPSKIAGDETNLYVVTYEGTQTLAKTGGAVRTVMANQGFMALGKSAFYWTSVFNGDLEHPKPTVAQLFSAPKAGGAGTALIVSDVGMGSAMAVDDSGVYFVLGKELQVLVPPATSGRKVADLASFVTRFVLDADALYVASGNAILRILKSGASPPTTLCTLTSDTLGMAVDGSHVYFTDSDGGLVVRVPKTGGPQETVAHGQARPVAIAVDDTRVYWANIGEGAIMARTK